MVTCLETRQSRTKLAMSYSHGEAHATISYCVSLLSSAWNQVGPQCYGLKQILKFGKLNLKYLFKLIQAFGISLSPQNPLGVVVKPHGQLVQI